ncbi:MAG TPA: OPT/YSL family transporter [Xanthobacteraceae bacterium]|nr:OPT/YSL family transporter [Xanthobacteraceae bacterium]
MTDVKAEAEARAPAPDQPHPSTFSPATLVLLIVLAMFGAIIGIQLILQLGVTPNTSIIGALVAMILARVPLTLFARYRSVHVQNLAQSNISAATFGAANSLLLPIGIPFLLGRGDLILPMLVGAALAMLLDAYLLYRMFDTKVFPATGTWPPGVAAAEAIKAGDQGGRQALLLGAGLAVGVVGSWLKIPMSAFGVAFIGNIAALTMFGIGLLIRGYTLPLTGIDMTQYYVPHGFMVGAGLVALVQVIIAIARRADEADAAGGRSDEELRGALKLGAVGYVAIAALIATIGGLASELSWPLLVAFVVYAAFAAFIHELLVGIAAMHSGWFPAFAVALITLIIGILIGFPPTALGLLVGFSAATGPAFADMGYDLKAGYILRGFGRNMAFERDGRRQQLYAAMLAFLIAIPIVWLAHATYFAQGLVPPVDRVYVAAIKAGASADVAWKLLAWAVPGAVIQFLGGPKRQLGVLLATGLLIPNPLAGWAVLVGIAIRVAVLRLKGEAAAGSMEVLAAGFIGGDALFGFFDSVLKTKPPLAK